MVGGFMNQMLYKYRSLDNFKYFVDIVLKNRLFAAKYKDLNDPMEGQYYYSKGELDQSIRNKLLRTKGDLRICSLSRIKDNQLMWSHYTNGHRGVAIGVRVTDLNSQIRSVIYDGLALIRNQDFNEQTAINILSHKLEVWNYEEEVRVFVIGRQYVNIEIEEIITGVKMSNSDFSFVRQLISKINPGINIIKAKTFIKN